MDHYHRIAASLDYLAEHYREQPSLGDLAGHANMSEHHFQRVFTRWAGISPKKFLQAITLEHARASLDASNSVLDVSLETGMSGPSRLHDLFISVEALSPGEYKQRGKGLDINYGFHDSHFGRVLLAESARGLVAMHFVEPGTEELILSQVQMRLPQANYFDNSALTQTTADTLFGQKHHRQINLLLSGSPFQIQVWRALLAIPEGECTTYSRLARAIRRDNAHRAVANAVGANPVAWLIPCHRVIRESGLLGGYRWGTGRKLALLGSERTLNPETRNTG
ncbi:MAG: methylated-DNA--[protein]-cysteine S-methyltransferase [Gammaproteobacteria bacterium]|nr:methylated-DNA--[protein]-cysteine S-methyltransferase [Gammaproteobacteria bacterium]